MSSLNRDGIRQTDGGCDRKLPCANGVGEIHARGFTVESIVDGIREGTSLGERDDVTELVVQRCCNFTFSTSRYNACATCEFNGRWCTQLNKDVNNNRGCLPRDSDRLSTNSVRLEDIAECTAHGTVAWRECNALAWYSVAVLIDNVCCQFKRFIRSDCGRKRRDNQIDWSTRCDGHSLVFTDNTETCSDCVRTGRCWREQSIRVDAAAACRPNHRYTRNQGVVVKGRSTELNG